MSKSHLLVVGLAAALTGWLFGPALLARSSFAFRDAAHFYHPLFEFEHDEWRAGRVPLWNPYENIGVPLAGETTSSLFYPGKLLFALPASYTRLYNAYIVGHVVLATVMSFAAARHFKASVAGAGLAALAYTFGGSVLFQYCNVVFLIGAAWLPLAILLIDRTLHAGRWLPALALGAVWALMITGGDPQMAYNTALAALLYALILWRAARRNSRNETDSTAMASGPADSAAVHGSPTARGVALLALAAVVGCTLAAVQILPAWSATQRSVRAAYDEPRNIYELAATATGRGSDAADDPASWYAGLLGESDDPHARDIYQFKVGPWRLVEFVWPNIAGRQFPVHRRWLDVLPAEGRIWTPTLYMGLLPIVLAAVVFSLRRRAAVEMRWFSWIAVWSMAASLGGYGLVWIAREVAGWFGTSLDGPVGNEVGGVYWFMTVVLPGYVYFRYPAKLTVLASLAISLLAARGWDEVWQNPTPQLRRVLIAALIASVSGLGVVLLFWSAFLPRLDAIAPDRIFGPFDVDGAWRDVVAGLLQTVVISCLLLVLAARSIRARVGPVAVLAGLVVVAADLAVAQRWLVPYTPAGAWAAQPVAAGRLPDDTEGFRVYRDRRWVPRMWQESSSGERLQQVVLWERSTFSPKYPLPLRVPLVEASGTLSRLDYTTLLDVARHPPGTEQPNRRPDGSVLDLLAARYALLSSRGGGVTPAYRPLDGNDLATVTRNSALPRAWIVHQAEIFPLLRSRAPSDVKRRTEEVLFPDGQPRNWRTIAALETDEPLSAELDDAPRGSGETCRVEVSRPQRVEIAAKLATGGIVILADTYDPDWTLTVESGGQARATQFHRANRVMRGVVLPPGEHRLVYRYQPAAVRWGAVISALGVALLAAAGLVAVASNRWRG